VGCFARKGFETLADGLGLVKLLVPRSITGRLSVENRYCL